MKVYDVIIIGAGPSGLFSALSLNTNDKKVLLLEKKSTPGKKLLLSGAGQCNITHDGDIKDFSTHYGDNFRFLKHSLSKFTNKDTIGFLRERGLKTITNENGKVFPETLKALDVMNILVSQCKENRVEIRYNKEVLATSYEEDYVFKVYVSGKEYTAKNLVISTGGKSYPVTGSTGDGYKFAKMMGHSIVVPQEALTPLIIEEFPFADLSGISFENTNMSLWRDGKKIKSFPGDVLITHNGVSGPGILNNSRYMNPGDIVKISFVESDNFEEFRKEFIKAINKNGKTMVKTLLKNYNLPKRFIWKILENLGIDGELRCSQLNKKKRNYLIASLTEFPLTIEKLGGFHIAMATKGGVSLKEINPKTMESRKVKGLYFIGEVLDIDGDTGGYNIQAAISTAFLAARNINEEFMK